MITVHLGVAGAIRSMPAAVRLSVLRFRGHLILVPLLVYRRECEGQG